MESRQCAGMHAHTHMHIHMHAYISTTTFLLAGNTGINIDNNNIDTNIHTDINTNIAIDFSISSIYIGDKSVHLVAHGPKP